MALSYKEYPADGATNAYDVTFGYLSRSHVFVFVDGALTAYKWVSSTRVELVNTPAEGKTVKVARLTDRVNRITTFSDGQTLLAGDLNAGDLQNFYILQETADQVMDGVLTGTILVNDPGSGYITEQWIQQQLEASIGGSDALTQLSNQIQEEVTNRDNAILAEQSARAAAIVAEAVARAAAITSALSDEVAARLAGDAATAALVATETTEREDAVSALADSISIVAAKADDNTAAIAAEESARVDAVSAEADARGLLEARMDSAESGISANATAVSDETARATSAEGAAASRLNALEATVDTPVTGLSAKVISQGSAITSLSSGKADASTVTAINTRVGTAEGNITSLQSSVSSLGTNKADVSSLTTLSAKLTKDIANTKASDFTADGLYWYDGFGGSPDSCPDPSIVGYFDIANVGRVARVNATTYWSQKSVLRPVAGRKYRFTAVVRVVTNATSGTLGCVLTYNGLDSSYGHGNPSVNATAPSGFIDSKNPISVADGWVTMVHEFSLAANGQWDYAWRPRLDMYQNAGATGGVFEIRQFLVEDITDSANTAFLMNAMTTGSSSEARILLKVNTSTNVASIEAVAASGDGTWNGSAIKLTSNLLQLAAKSILFGSNTVFEDTYNTFYTTYSSIRNRWGGPFGASTDLLEWYGPTTVALNSETKYNGTSAKGTDGKLYQTGAQVVPPIVIGGPSGTTGFNYGHYGAFTNVAQSIAATAAGGTGTGYSYLWEIVQPGGTGSYTVSGLQAATLSFTGTCSLGQNVQGYAKLTVTDSAGNAATRVWYWSYSETH
jgi:hypothetical protein